MTTGRHLQSLLLLPFNATVTIPALILWQTDWTLGSSRGPVAAAAGAVMGAGCGMRGLTLMVTTVRLFARVGRGTLAPWDPTVHLVVEGPYRYVGNPMISGVGFVILGEALALGSLPLLAWFATFMMVNMVYMPLFEEPGLVARFGEGYREYSNHVPRWIPRSTPWSGNGNHDNRTGVGGPADEPPTS